MYQDKKALLVVSVGTSYTQAIASCIEPVETAIQKAALGFDLFRAFTSEKIIHKLKSVCHLSIRTPAQALEYLAQEGYGVIAVQPTHIWPGTEYHDLVRAVEKFSEKHQRIQITLGQPLLFESGDYEHVAHALGKWMPKTKDNEAVFLIGHGTQYFSNSDYLALSHALESLPTRVVYAANVEASGMFVPVIDRLKAWRVSKVYLMPFMLVAGRHARKDMAGNHENSWSSCLKNEGFEVEVILRGFGECEDFCLLYAKKAAMLV